MSKAALYKKIIAVMSEVGQMQKDGDINDKNGKKMYSYLSEEQTTGELQKAFVKHGLVLFPIKVESEIVILESFAYDKETKTPITKVIVTYKICDSDSGESEELMSIGYGSDSQDKGSNKAMTGAFKYVQRQTFMISTGDDGDHTPNHCLDKQVAKPPEASQQRQQYQPSSNNQPPAQAPTSQPSASSEHPMVKVFAMIKELGWKANDANEFASNCLGKPVKYPMKDYVKTREDWEKIEQAMIATKNGMKKQDPWDAPLPEPYPEDAIPH